MMPHDEHRFKGAISEEYAALLTCIPHYFEIQDSAARLLRDFAQAKQAATLRVIEAGVGTGFTAVRLLATDPRVHITAVDNEKSMLDQAREALKESADRITFAESDALEYLQNCPPESFDAFISAFMLHNLPSSYRGRITSEIDRILVPGGLYVNADKLAVDDLALHHAMLEEQIGDFDTILRGKGRPDLAQKWIQHYRDDEKIRFDEREQKDLLRARGFTGIQTVYRKQIDATVTARKPSYSAPNTP